MFNQKKNLFSLGTGECGKSTFIKQMRIIYDKGFSLEEKQTFISLIHKNIFMGMKNIIDAMTQLNIQYKNLKNVEHSERILNIDNDQYSLFEPFYLESIKELWIDAGIIECFGRSNEYQLPYSME